MKLSTTLLVAYLLRPVLSTHDLQQLSPHDAKQLAPAPVELDLTKGIEDDLKDVTTCAACYGIQLLLKGIAAVSTDLFVKALIEVCKISGAEDDDVCEGAVKREGPIVANALKHLKVGSATSDEFCITFFGLCKFPKIAKWSAPFPSSKPSTPRPQPSGKKPIKVVHFSDIHIDSLYVSGSNTNCTKPICCRPYTAADAPGNTTSPAGPNGDHNCDTPVSLEKSMYAAIKKLVPDAAFSIFTGDIVDHAIWNTSRGYNTQEINHAYDQMAQNLGTVYGTAGNHEASPVNAFQPKSVGNSVGWLYDLLAVNWSRWISSEADAEAGKIGAFSTKFANGNLRVISINTNFNYRQNYWLFQEPMLADPDHHLAWLVGELDSAEKAGENVYIIGHMPTGISDAFRQGSHYLDQIYNRYSSTIAAMFFGHTHVDHFEITYSNYSHQKADTALITSYICPSLTPTSGMPSFRVYDVDPETFGVLDHTTYIASLDDPAFQTAGPVWTKYYSAKDVYGSALSPPVTDPSAELNAAFWHRVTETFESNDSAFQAYYARKRRGYNTAACTGDCKTGEICELRAGRAENNCWVPTPGVHFSKRALNRVQERDECGISVIRATLSSLAVNREALQRLQTYSARGN